MPLSDVRSSETSAHNTQVKLSKSSHVQIFMVSYFRGSYFHVLAVGRENHEKLDLVKISRYMVLDLASFPDLFQIRENEKKKTGPGKLPVLNTRRV